jgi:hypothetical protein
MKRFFRNIAVAALFALALLPISCTEKENENQTQMDRIVSYMTSRMRLVSEEEAAQSMTGEKLPYYTRRGDAYRHITNVYRANRPTKLIAEGSLVTFRYEAYSFTSAPANIPFATNNRGTGAILASQYGLDTTYWDFSPAERRLGVDPIIKGLELTLPECAQGDTVYTFMPSSMAYGDRIMGAVAATTPVMMVTVIDKVE